MISLRMLLAALVLALPVVGQGTPVAPGYVLIEYDMIVPLGVVYGDGTLEGTPWAGGVIPYDFHGSVDSWQRHLMTLALAEWEALANVDFVPRTTQPDYILVRTTGSNTSYVGMNGGVQNLTLNNWNRRGTPYHELAHAMSFIHEHSRPDRDNFVAIQWQNINPTYWSAYNLHAASVTVGPYDFGSCMHYPDWGFSINGLPTILALPAYAHLQDLMGQRDVISQFDALAARSIYGSPPAPAITSAPQSLHAGSGSQVLRVTGTRFCTRSVLTWAGNPLPTRYAGPDVLIAHVDGTLLSAAGTVPIAVENAAPGGGAGPSQPLTILPGPAPASVATARVDSLGWGCRGQPHGPRLEISAPPAIGTTVSLSGSLLVPGAVGWLFASPPASRTTTLAYEGCEIQVDPLAMVPVSVIVTSSSGSWSQSFAMPNDPALAGTELDLQIAVPDPDSEIGFSLTNGLRIRLGT